MLPSARELILGAAVSRMYLSDENTLIVYSDDKELHFIDLQTLKIKRRVPLSSHVSEEFDYYNRPIALKNQSAYIKISKKGKEYILNLKSKIEKEVSFDYNKNQKVTKAHFSKDASLLITGNDIGRTYLIDSVGGSLVYEFPFVADSISSVAISDEKKYALSASFGKTLHILHLDSLVCYSDIKLTSVIEKIQFISEDIFLAITRDGSVLKIDALHKRIIKETKLADTIWPSEICVSHSKKFVYIGTRESVIYALHVKSMDQIFSLPLFKTGITSLVRTPKYFIVGFKTGEIQFFNHREFEENFILHVKLKQMREAIELFNKNIFLMTHRETRVIYDMWSEQKESIVQLMSNGAIDESQKLASDYMFHPKCKLEMQELEELQPDLAALQRYIRSSAYEAAYELVGRNPSLKLTLLYTKLEDIWQKALQKAQILLSRDPILNKAKAREELYQFEKVEAKKDLIEKMLKNANTFTRAEMAVKNKNFNLYFKIVRENDFLKFTPLYKKVLSLAEKIKTNVLESLRDNNYIIALENAKVLGQFSIYLEHSQKLEEFINSLLVIDYHVKNKNLLEAVKIQSKLKIQSSYEPIRKLENMKRAFMKSMLEKIEKLEFTDVYMQVKTFFGISICKNETSNVMKRLYLAQMMQANVKEKELVDWHKTLQNYSEYFHFDKLMVDFFPKLELQISIEKFLQDGISKKRNFPRNIIIYK